MTPKLLDHDGTFEILRDMTTPASLRDPLRVLAADHFRQLQMCDLLERIADDLPWNVDAEMADHVLGFMKKDMPLHIRDEEKGLFPLLRKRAEKEDKVEALLDQLEHEHSTDSGFAAEVGEALRQLAQGQPPNNPDMTGYMLRGFFETQRRHILWENGVVLPLARRRLAPADLEELERIMKAHRGMR